jgi:hypothetical protein
MPAQYRGRIIGFAREGHFIFLVSTIVAYVAAVGAGVAAAEQTGESSDSAKQEEPIDELDRWAPSLGIFGGFQQQHAEATIDPSLLAPPPLQCTPDPQGVDCSIDPRIQPFAEDDDEIRAFRSGVSLELMSPRLFSGFGHPRFFIHVDPMLSTGFERRIAGSGKPGPMIEADFPPAVTRTDEANYSGQGTRLLADIDPFVLNAGIGIAFTFDVSDSRFRIKPSAEYLRERLKVTGETNRVVQVSDEVPRVNTPSDFRFIEMSDSDEQTYHAIGAGLEIEIDGNRLGPFVVTPFIAGRAYRFIGNLDVSLSDSNEFGESVEFEFERDQWQWAARFGVRLRWVPK